MKMNELKGNKRPQIKPGVCVGKLTVVEATPERKNGYTIWLCVCECGGSIRLDTRTLQRGTVRDCGCETVVKPGQRDITGQRFGKLIALAPTDKRADQGSVVWLCECDCGNTAEVSSRRLIRGQVRSCGCLSAPEVKDYIGRHFGRLEVIAYAGKMRKNQSTVTYWKCRCECGNEVVVGQTELQNGDTQSCGCLQRDKMKEVLGVVADTSAFILERLKNAPRKNNKSGYTGVFQMKDGCWIAYISFRKKRYYLGRYHKIEDAIEARKRGEEMHDEFLEWYYREYPKQEKENMDRNTRRKKMSRLHVSTVDSEK